MSIVIPILIVALIGLIAGLGLSLASKFMAVPTDEKQEKIRECLPGANCGACGYSGCDGYAEAIAKGEAEPNKCAPGGETAAKQLAELLGVTVDTEKKVAFIACSGSREFSKLKYSYEGMMSCAAANLVQAGPLECEFGCIGYGDCQKACQFGAIKIINNKPTVCEDLCVGCGKCVSVCPKSVIKLIKKGTPIKVSCQNKLKGAPVVKACAKSCIACGMCQKACENGAITVADNLAVIDYKKCTSCGKCKAVCKRNVII